MSTSQANKETVTCTSVQNDCTCVLNEYLNTIRARGGYSPTCMGARQGYVSQHFIHICAVRVRTAMNNSHANHSLKIVAIVQLTRL